MDVSVSLRSIIHSYMTKDTTIQSPSLNFRLLTEYHSFLSDWKFEDEIKPRVSISLQSIIHSYTIKDTCDLVSPFQ